MTRLVLRSFPAAAALLLALAGCASHPAAGPVAIAIAAPPPPPAAPDGISVGMPVPPVGADGVYLTINHGLAPAQSVWHLRSALNVAALACRGPEEKAIVAAYNDLLRDRRAVLAAAYRDVAARYKAEHGSAWQNDQDADMTRVYNFFAQPPAQQRFCAIAAAVLAEARAAPAAEFTAFAATALPRLEAPFTDVYRLVDGYRHDLAAWQSRYGTPPVQTASR